MAYRSVGLVARATGVFLLVSCGSDAYVPIPQPTAHVDGGGDRPVDASIDESAPPADAPTTFGDHLLLKGVVITPAGVMDGEVLIVSARITCVGPGTTCSDSADGQGIPIVDTQGIISPGLIDTHNHILFDVFDGSDWLPAKVYQNHDEWPKEARYGAMLDVKQCLANDSQGKPAWCANTPYGSPAGSLRCEMDKWGELKALIAGTTSIVGLPGTSAACFGSLSRSIDVAQNGFAFDKIQTSAIFPPSNPDGVCANFTKGTTDAFLVHCGEGVDAKALAEFTTLGKSTTPDCLYASQTTITHGTAFTATEFATMGQNGMKLTWSPASNVALYGQTANLPLALDANVLVALAPDWSMGGSQNLLDEIRFADTWDNAHFANRLSTQDLHSMTTINAAKVLGLDSFVGSIQVGMAADLAVFSGDTTKPFDAIAAASPKDVKLVMVGGTVLYGDMQFANSAMTTCETVDICGTSKFLCVATNETTNKFSQTYADIKDALENAMTAADQQTPDDGFNFAPLAPLVTCP